MASFYAEVLSKSALSIIGPETSTQNSCYALCVMCIGLESGRCVPP